MNFWSFLGLASAADMRALREELQAAKEENEALRVQALERTAADGQAHMAELRELFQAVSREVGGLRVYAEQECAAARTARRELLTAVGGAKDELSDILRESGERRNASEERILRSLETNRAQGAETQARIGTLREQLEAMEKRVIEGLDTKHAQGAEVQKQIRTLGELLDASETEMTALRDWLQENAARQEAAFLQLRESLSSLSAAQGQGVETLARANMEQERRLLDGLTRMREDLNEAREALLGAVRAADPRGVLERLDDDQRNMRDALSETQNAASLLPEMKEYLSMLWEVTKLVWVNDLLDGVERELAESN